MEGALDFSISLMTLKIDIAAIAGEEIKTEMKRLSKEIIEEMIEDLSKRLSSVLKRLANAAETKARVRLKSVIKAVDETMELAMYAHLGNSIKDTADAAKAIASVLSKKNFDMEDLRDPTKLVAKVLDIPSDDPLEILKKAQYDLSGKSERAAELFKRMSKRTSESTRAEDENPPEEE